MSLHSSGWPNPVRTFSLSDGLISHNQIFSFHPWCSTLEVPSFLGWIKFHFMDIPCFTCPFICQWTWGLHPHYCNSMHSDIQISLQDPTFNSFEYIPRKRIAGPCGFPLFSILRNHCTISHSGCSSLHSQQCIRISVFLHPGNTCYCLSLTLSLSPSFSLLPSFPLLFSSCWRYDLELWKMPNTCSAIEQYPIPSSLC